MQITKQKNVDSPNKKQRRVKETSKKRTPKKRKLGRPSKYQKEKILPLAEKFLDEECGIKEERALKSEKSSSLGESSSYALLYIPKLPTKRRLAEYLGIHIDTLYEWEKKYTEFSDITHKLSDKYEEMLLVGGLSKKFDGRIVNLLLSSKFGYAEKKKIDITAGSIFDKD